MKKYFMLILFCTLLCTCSSHKYLPIVKTNKFYPPLEKADIVQSVPSESIFIGTIKLVLREYRFEMTRDSEIVLNNLKEEAARAGARYIYLLNFAPPSSDYYSGFMQTITRDFGEGYTIEAELYR
ncbi:MAG: hypothetical protein IKN91_07855 [Paludibacteraceae bacterium]|nr:hypothetical protein [Paludibacteraceae bacterium]